MGSASYRAVQDCTYDAVVIGSGYAGFAAAMTLSRTSKRTLLVSAHGDLLWESGRAFEPTLGTADGPLWLELTRRIAHVAGSGQKGLDGAIAEVVASDMLASSNCHALYDARPVSADRVEGLVLAVRFATRNGLNIIRSKQWIDASETGELLRLLEPDWEPAAPSSLTTYVALQHPEWTAVEGGPHHPELGLLETDWETERLLPVQVSSERRWHHSVIAALAALERNIGSEISRATVSHLSFVPYPTYAGSRSRGEHSGNVANAVPALSRNGITSLGDRFTSGLVAADRLKILPAVNAGSNSSEVERVDAGEMEITVDVCVVGCGTGGSLAALAAAKKGASVLAIEPMPFLGGVGTGGGIHVYWFGVPGGLQMSIDNRTKDLMTLFGRGPFGDGPFNPWAKMFALDDALSESGARTLLGALMYEVEVVDGVVLSVKAATSEGIVSIRARSFIDGTGDGELCALAGAGYSFGREVDGLLHAYSQSSGRLELVQGRPRMRVVNFDAGFCDPTDNADLTRARIEGVRQYLTPHPFTNYTRPTYIAPALGLRQGRQIATDYVLTLDDQISRRRFADVIGYTASHMDNHAADFEFESDEAVFWLWANRQFNVPIACETNYRMLLPRGLENVWIGSRCLGVSQDAHYVTRMQRDMQRVGEAAGLAAAQAALSGKNSRDISVDSLQTDLARSKALIISPRALETGFGVGRIELPMHAANDVAEDSLEEFARADNALAALQTSELAVDSALAAAISQLDDGIPGAAMWWLYRNPALARYEVVKRITHRDPMVSWLAATIMAMWEDSYAEPRLLQAIEQLEYGFPQPRVTHLRRQPTPETSAKLVPNWLCAVALLRRCGTGSSLPYLKAILAKKPQSIDIVATVAITLERYLQRAELTDIERTAIVDMLFEIDALNRNQPPQPPNRNVGGEALAGIKVAGQKEVTLAENQGDARFALQIANARADVSWQVDLVLAKAMKLAKLPPLSRHLRYQEDARALVRKSFQSALAASITETVSSTVKGVS
ncbi:hypothetical protein LSHI6S_03233 [Leifsonia shinshuensis]